MLLRDYLSDAPPLLRAMGFWCLKIRKKSHELRYTPPYRALSASLVIQSETVHIEVRYLSQTPQENEGKTARDPLCDTILERHGAIGGYLDLSC